MILIYRTNFLAIISIIKYYEDKGKYRILNVNIGDSRIVLGEKQQKGYVAIELSTDHKPNAQETQRIISAGTFLLRPFFPEFIYLFLQY